MLIKINSDDALDAQIESLKKHFDVGTASKACALAATSFSGTSDLLDVALVKIERLESVLFDLKQGYLGKLEADLIFKRLLLDV